MRTGLGAGPEGGSSLVRLGAGSTAPISVLYSSTT